LFNPIVQTGDPDCSKMNGGTVLTEFSDGGKRDLEMANIITGNANYPSASNR
jgi:hypothetical protein